MKSLEQMQLEMFRKHEAMAKDSDGYPKLKVSFTGIVRILQSKADEEFERRVMLRFGVGVATVFVFIFIMLCSHIAHASHYDVLDSVNSKVNEVVYVSDYDNYGKLNYWAMPGEFYKRGGDCEDYVIAKYYALKNKGFDVSSARYVYTFVKETNEAHAILQFGGYYLDNRSSSLLSKEEMDKRYINTSSTKMQLLLKEL